MEAGPGFLTPDAMMTFNRLQLAFTEASIFKNFALEYYIWIKTGALGYAINEVLSQLIFGISPYGIVTKADLGQWYPAAFFFKKMILAKIQYKIHNSKLLAIVKAFKI